MQKKKKKKKSEYGHVAYPIKGKEAYNNKLANMLPLHAPLTPGWGKKGHFFSFLKVVMFLNKLSGMKHFSEGGHVAYQF